MLFLKFQRIETPVTLLACHLQTPNRTDATSKNNDKRNTWNTLRNRILHHWLAYSVHLPTLTHYLLQWPLFFLQGLQKTLQWGLSAPQGIQNAHYQRRWKQSVVWSAGVEPALCPIKRKVPLYPLPRRYLKRFNKRNCPFPSSKKRDRHCSLDMLKVITTHKWNRFVQPFPHRR